MADEIAFPDPQDSEAFPGLLFGLTSDRDRVTLQCFDLAKSANLKLISLDRRGYFARHNVPGDFAHVPATDDSMIPVREPDRDRPPRERPSTLHNATGLRFRLNQDGEGLALTVNLRGDNFTVANIDRYGQIFFTPLDSYIRDTLNACGLRIPSPAAGAPNTTLPIITNPRQFNSDPNPPTDSDDEDTDQDDDTNEDDTDEDDDDRDYPDPTPGDFIALDVASTFEIPADPEPPTTDPDSSIRRTR